MAKKKSKAKPKKGLLEEQQVGQDFTAAADLGKQLGLTTPLERLDLSYILPLIDPQSQAYAGRRSDELKSVLDSMKGGLAGLTATESQGLREQGQRELDRQYLNTIRDLSRAQRRSNTLGAASAAQTLNAGRQRTEQQGQLEQDLQLKNIDVQDNRRNALFKAIGEAEANEFDKARLARDEFNSLSKFNIGQSNSDRAGLAAVLAGLTSYGLSKKNAAQTYSLAKSGKSVGGAGAGYDPSTLVNAFSKIIDNKYGQGTTSGI